MLLLRVHEREHATMLAALRVYQRAMEGNGDEPPRDVWDIATNGDTVQYMSPADIDGLCERINRDSPPQSFEGMSRKDALKLIYRDTHRDFKGRLPDGTRTLMVNRGGMTMLVNLVDLTEDEIARRLPSALRRLGRRA